MERSMRKKVTSMKMTLRRTMREEILSTEASKVSSYLTLYSRPKTSVAKKVN